MKLLKIAGVVLLAFVLIFAITFFANGADLANYAFWAPKQMAVKNQVFHQSQPYVDGKINYIGLLMHQYHAADSGSTHQVTLGQEIISESETCKCFAQLPLDQQQFISTLKEGN